MCKTITPGNFLSIWLLIATLALLLISLSFPGIEEVTNFGSKNVVGFHFLKKNLMLPWPV